MSVSGVKCKQDVVDMYNKFKTAKTDIAFMVCKIEDSNIVIEEAPAFKDGEKDAVDDKNVPVVYKAMEDLCIKGGCRYAFFTFKWNTSGGDRDSIVFIQYCDDNAPSKQKLTYSTSKTAITKPCTGINKVIEANDKDEISYHEILELLKKMKR